jgi:hypothetical protein
LTEGGDEDNKDQEMPEDLLSQLQLCTLEMLKVVPFQLNLSLASPRQ